MTRGRKTNPPKITKLEKNVTLKPPTENNDEGFRYANKIIGSKVRLKCKNNKQKDYANLIKEKEVVICSGPPGTGKSFVSISVAIELLQNTTNSFNKILIVTPAVEAEENLGFLPGDLKEKLAPFLASSIDIVDKILGEGTRLELEKHGFLGAEPLGFIRGKTIDNTLLIVEECQNMSPNQMKTLLTRIGSNSKYVISGDLDQSDRYKNIEQSGLYDAVKKHANIPEVGIFEFNINDIVRNPIISKLLRNYEDKTEEEDYLSKKD
jgi:phosphate starvation-inducible PhoH-like protein